MRRRLPIECVFDYGARFGKFRSILIYGLYFARFTKDTKDMRKLNKDVLTFLKALDQRKLSPYCDCANGDYWQQCYERPLSCKLPC